MRRTQGAENRLVSVISNGQTTQFAYDGDGARVLQVKPNGDQTAYPSASLRAGSGGLTEVTLPGDVIFADEFESGSFSAWSAEQDTENDLNVTLASALVGAQGMAALARLRAFGAQINAVDRLALTCQNPRVHRA